MARAGFKSAAASTSQCSKPKESALFGVDYVCEHPRPSRYSDDDRLKPDEISEVTQRMEQIRLISAAKKDSKLRNLRSGVDPGSARFKCVNYYSYQTCNALKEGPPIDYPVHISGSGESMVHPSWYSYLDSAIRDINEAAPGLRLYKVTDETKARIKVVGQHKDGAQACPSRLLTRHSGEYVKYEPAIIYLGPNLSESETWKKQTSIHEFLHALGFDHEHQRRDAGESMKNKCSDYNNAIQETVDGLTRFDPFSVMMYPEGDCLERDHRGDTVWLLKFSKDLNDTMSELDKVGLNLLYPPCKSPSYNPKRSAVNRMWYCGRHVMGSHNTPAENMTDGRCGPDNWANCPACRTLKNPKVDEFLCQGRWQGWSGLVYCGKDFLKQSPEHDGYCGPDNGDPCCECGRILYPGYQLQSDNDCVLL